MNEFSYKINGNSYKVVVNNTTDNTVELDVNGTPYVVEVEGKVSKPAAPIKRTVAPAPAPAPKTAPAPAAAPVAAGANTVQSPLPGIILDIQCREGDTVKKGQVIIILEAMKMENNVTASADGKISKILVSKGDSVLEGTPLVVIG